MAQQIPRSAWPFEGIPGTWHGRRAENGHCTASFCCPKCKKIGSLSDHTIDHSGHVKPSVVCPREGCTFHQYIQLVGWGDFL